MKCRICNIENSACFSAVVLGKYTVNYYHCPHCDFLQTEDPYWLHEAYSRSINISDTGYMVRNLFYAKQLTVLLYYLFGKNGRYLDYAGGYGVFVRLMRDIGFDYYWDDKYTKNLFSAGFEWDKKSHIDALTSFESFEHFINPIEEIKKLLNITETIIFSTELHPTPIPKAGNWWYYGLDHGQHISFYSRKTFEVITKKLDAYYYYTNSFQIISRKPITKWKLLLPILNRFGLHKIVSRQLNSKTWEDYKLCSEVQS